MTDSGIWFWLVYLVELGEIGFDKRIFISGDVHIDF